LKRRGHEAEFYFIADIFDAFDSIPTNMMKHEKMLTPHLGKPLSDVPDPEGCHSSFGEHFLMEAKGIMDKFDVKPKFFRMNEIYGKGDWDNYAKFFLEHATEAKKIVADSAMKKIEDMGNWSPLMPICEKCGRVATTRVISHGSDDYEYACDQDVKYTKGCGNKGKNRISDHKWKLTWRLHWPTWYDYFKTSCEGAGMDHHTRGG
jgi:lysyl-tRNA synthetase class 1